MRTLLTALIAALLMAGCTTAPDRENGMPPQSPSADEAQKFGGIVPPASAKVLGVAHDAGIDERYRLVLGMPPGDVANLLSASGFTAPLVPDAGPYNDDFVTGFDLSKASDVVATEDSLGPSGGRKQTVFRKVLVDRTDPASSVVHLWLFTT